VKRQRGSRARGNSYEAKACRQLRKHFDALRTGEWIRFRDYHGTGFAQPDSFLVLPDRLLCFECKLSTRQDGVGQIASLYKPLLAHIFQKPVTGVLVVKYLYEVPAPLIEEPEEATSSQLPFLTWQYLG
jgi:hypothetical protein